MYSFLNNEIIQHSKAFVHVDDLAIQRGYGVFDFFKIVKGHPFFLEDYLDRFFNSARILRLEVPLERARLKEIIYELAKRNSLEESGMKMILTGGYSSDGYLPGAHPNFIITQQKLVLPSSEVFNTGIKIITHEFMRDVAEAKTLNYTMGIWLHNKIKESNAADVLYCKDNVVTEFPRCNFFIVRNDNSVLTPSTNVLHGITRKNLLAMHKKFDITESIVTLDDVYNAREAFLTSTTKRIIPIVKVNNTTIGNGKPGRVTLALLEELIALEVRDAMAATPRLS